MKKTFVIISVIIISVLVIILGCITFSACDAKRMRDYYSDKDNYGVATGIVTHIKYNDDKTVLYLGFSRIKPPTSDETFKIVGENLTIAKKNGIDSKLKIGDRIEFITAPLCFGDGYVSPIVAITIDGETLLEFEEGFVNLNKWLEEN